MMAAMGLKGVATAAPRDGEMIDKVAAIVKSDLVPLIDDIDRKGLYPADVLRKLGQAGLYSQHVGGPAGSLVEGGLLAAIEGMSAVGEQCLSTSFMTWCQDACAWYLHNSDNAALRDELLPKVASGQQLGGTGLSNPMKAFAEIEQFRLRGERVDGGYIVTGQLPWVSNLGPDHCFGAVFDAPGKNHKVMAMIRCDMEGVKIAQNAHFCALEGTGTYSVMFKKAFVPDSMIVADPAEPYLIKIMPGFILLQAGMALGQIKGCVEIMKDADKTLSHVNSFLPERPVDFEEIIAVMAAKVAELAATPFENTPDYVRQVLEARLLAGDWTVKAAHAAMLHAGARGYLIDAPAQRRLREAYFVAIVTPATKHLRKELDAIGQGRGCMRTWKETCAALAH